MGDAFERLAHPFQATASALMDNQLFPGGLTAVGPAHDEMTRAGQGAAQDSAGACKSGLLIKRAIARICFKVRLLRPSNCIEQNREIWTLVLADLFANDLIEQLHTAQRINVRMHGSEHAVCRFQGTSGEEGGVRVGVKDDEIVMVSVVIH